MNIKFKNNQRIRGKVEVGFNQTFQNFLISLNLILDKNCKINGYFYNNFSYSYINKLTKHNFKVQNRGYYVKCTGNKIQRRKKGKKINENYIFDEVKSLQDIFIVSIYIAKFGKVRIRDISGLSEYIKKHNLKSQKDKIDNNIYEITYRKEQLDIKHIQVFERKDFLLDVLLNARNKSIPYSVSITEIDNQTKLDLEVLTKIGFIKKITYGKEITVNVTNEITKKKITCSKNANEFLFFLALAKYLDTQIDIIGIDANNFIESLKIFSKLNLNYNIVNKRKIRVFGRKEEPLKEDIIIEDRGIEKESTKLLSLFLSAHISKENGAKAKININTEKYYEPIKVLNRIGAKLEIKKEYIEISKQIKYRTGKISLQHKESIENLLYLLISLNKNSGIEIDNFEIIEKKYSDILKRLENLGLNYEISD